MAASLGSIARLPHWLQNLVVEFTFLALFGGLFFTVTFGLSIQGKYFSFVLMVLVAGLIVWLRTHVLGLGVVWKRSIVRVILYVLCLQGLFLIYSPLKSVLSQQGLEAFGVVQVVTDEHCPLQEYQVAAQFVFGEKDQTLVREPILAGGIFYTWKRLDQAGIISTDHRWYRDAMTMDGTLYTSNVHACIGMRTYIHELTHVYQQRHRSHTKWQAVTGNVTTLYYQLTDPTPLYDYGGYEGLVSAKRSGVQLRDFHHEQQAEIVADYYLYSTFVTEQSSDFLREFYSLLEYYAVQL